MNAKTCGNGFCTFNSRYTKYSLSGVRWRNGQGDIFREFADACRAEGIECSADCAVGDNGVRKTPGGLFQNGSPAVESVIPTPVEVVHSRPDTKSTNSLWTTPTASC